jgi:hypothetical protein
MKFSERYGYTEVRTLIQHESMDIELRTDLWNTTRAVFKAVTVDAVGYTEYSLYVRTIWEEHWRLPSDEIPVSINNFESFLKNTVMSGKWFQVYDLIEYLVGLETGTDWDQELAGIYNLHLERNLAGYRIIENRVVPIDSETDLVAIQDGLDAATPIAGARHHLANALALLSDREHPDYANSVKESISAVESVCTVITGKDTLGVALKYLKANGVAIHPALENAWSRMYGYTSDADGVRHAAVTAPEIDQAIAKYFLVACSAFINLLLTKAAKAGIELGT